MSSNEISIRDHWDDLLAASQEVVESHIEAVRVANLVLAREKARELGLVEGGSESALGKDIERLAQYPIEVEFNLTAVAVLREAAAKVAASPFDGPFLEAWIELSQTTDPHRKTRGAYPTPGPLASALVESTLAPYVDREEPPRVVDPSSGNGALLIAAFRFLREQGDFSTQSIVRSLFGCELDPQTRELGCLLLWLAAGSRDVELDQISKNIALGNAITRNWNSDERPFDVLLMNPPWESLRHSGKNGDPHARERKKTVERLKEERTVDPDLPPLFSAQGRGDRNLFKAFVELAPHLVSGGGRIGALIPAAFASDYGMKSLRDMYISHLSLERWTSFENRNGYFPIDGRYKFGILVGSRSPSGTEQLHVRSFAENAEEVNAPHLTLQREDLQVLGGRARMILEFTDQREAQILATMLRTGEALFGSPSIGTVSYSREVDMTNGRKKGLFVPYSSVGEPTPERDGSIAEEGDGSGFVPLVEGRMVGQYDCFQKSWIEGRGRSAKWVANRSEGLQSCRPQYVIEASSRNPSRIAVCDVTAATNTRTVHAAWVPPRWTCGNTAPVLQFEDRATAFVGLGILNSLIFDWMARRIVAGLHLNKFYLATMAWPSLSAPARAKVRAGAVYLTRSNPRYSAFDATIETQPVTGSGLSSWVEAHVQIEKEVAKGFELTRTDLELILKRDEDDRRGFWRYYDAKPESLVVVERLLAGYAG